MPSYNKVIQMGNLTRDPELSYTPSQTSICKFGIATSKSWIGQDGHKNEKVCFVDCTAFKKTAENINKYFKKGDPIFIEGELEFDTWTAQDGSKRSKHSVNVLNFQFVKPANSGQPQQQSAESSVPDDDIPF